MIDPLATELVKQLVSRTTEVSSIATMLPMSVQRLLIDLPTGDFRVDNNFLDNHDRAFLIHTGLARKTHNDMSSLNTIGLGVQHAILQARIHRLEGALEEDEKQFSEYCKLHYEKGKVDSDEKAIVNFRHVRRIRRVLNNE